MNTLYVGIDASSKSNVVYLMFPNGDKHSNFSVANSHALLQKKQISAGLVKVTLFSANDIKTFQKNF